LVYLTARLLPRNSHREPRNGKPTVFLTLQLFMFRRAVSGLTISRVA
jgi:hypothetical protein